MNGVSSGDLISLLSLSKVGQTPCWESLGCAQIRWRRKAILISSSMILLFHVLKKSVFIFSQHLGRYVTDIFARTKETRAQIYN